MFRTSLGDLYTLSKQDLEELNHGQLPAYLDEVACREM
jgi:hypothetical protein